MCTRRVRAETVAERKVSQADLFQELNPPTALRGVGRRTDGFPLKIRLIGSLGRHSFRSGPQLGWPQAEEA